MKRYEVLEIEIIRIGDDVIATSLPGDNDAGYVDDIFSDKHAHSTSLNGYLD